MKNILSRFGNSAKFVATITVASIVGGAAAATVMAAIPNSDGTVSSCYKNNTGSLRVIDTSNGQSCSSSESSLTLSSNGTTRSQSAFAQLNSDGTLNMSQSKGISGFKLVEQGDSGSYLACFEIHPTPLSGYMQQSGTPTGFTQTAGQTGSSTNIETDGCGSSFNAVAGSVYPDFSYYNFAFFN